MREKKSDKKSKLVHVRKAWNGTPLFTPTILLVDFSALWHLKLDTAKAKDKESTQHTIHT